MQVLGVTRPASKRRGILFSKLMCVVVDDDQCEVEI